MSATEDELMHFYQSKRRGRQSEDWMIKGLIEHDNYAEKFYKFDEPDETTEKLRDKFVPEGIKREIENLDFRKLFAELTKKPTVNSDEVLAHHLRLENGWEHHVKVGQYMKWQFDFRKGDVGLEIETRQNTNFLHDLLRLEIGYRKHGLEHGLKCGVIISYYRKSVRKLGYGAFIEEFDRWMAELKDIIEIAIPLWVVGLKKPISNRSETHSC